MVVGMRNVVAVVVSRVVRVSEDQSTANIYDKTNDRNRNRLDVMDRFWLEQALDLTPIAKACELMCQPSARSAMELNHQPAMISTSIIAAVIHMTSLVPRCPAGFPESKV